MLILSLTYNIHYMQICQLHHLILEETLKMHMFKVSRLLTVFSAISSAKAQM